MDDQRKDHTDTEDSLKGTASNNYKPITCLTMMWKILTTKIKEEIYYSPTSPEEQKGCLKNLEVSDSYFT